MDFFDEDRCAVDTALGYIWPVAGVRNVRVAVLERPLDEVKESLRRLNYPRHDDRLGVLANRLAAMPCPRFSFHGLNEEAECRRLFEWASGKDFDRNWWLELKDRNLQCDRGRYVSDVVSNLAGFRNLYGGVA